MRIEIHVAPFPADAPTPPEKILFAWLGSSLEVAYEPDADPGRLADLIRREILAAAGVSECERETASPCG